MITEKFVFNYGGGFMKQEEKELLLKDLCARLPYGVKCKVSYNSGVINDADATLYGMDKDGFLMFDEIGGDHREFLCKPYLFPLSSMTPKQKAELSMLVVGVEDIFKSFLIEVEFYHKHHIDYRGLIPMGLAIDATGLNIY